MFKKLLLSSLAVITAGSMYARFLTPEEALARANAVAAASGISKAPAASSMKLTRTVNNAADEASLYIFEGNGNAMILPADDQAAPVLGYVEGYARGEMPPQMNWWLEQYALQIDFLKTAPSRVLSIEEATRRVARADKAPIPQLLSTVWNQDAPFNNLCPMSGSRRTYTGCVATAAAQVMKYFNYPEAGTGTITYSDNGTTRTLALDGKAFDWSNMRDSYNGSYSATQASAVAYLMQACGYAAEMNYGTSSSGTQSVKMLLGARKYLGYNSQARSIRRDYYSPQEWEDLIYANLRTVGPVYYAGDDGQAGHAFVCDGYQGDGFFHFNWGWGGAYDGFFKLDALNPEGQGIGGNTGGFNYNQQAFLNFTRPGAELIQLPQEAPVTQYGNLSGTVGTLGRSLNLTSDEVETMNTFAANSSGETQVLDFGLKAVSTDGGEPYYATTYSDFTLENYQGFSALSLSVPSGLEDGTYNFYPVVKYSGTGDWMEFNHTYGKVYYVPGTISRGRLSSVENIVPGSVEVSGLTLESALSAGNSFKISYSANNPGTTLASVGLTPCVAIRTSAGLGLIGQGESRTVSLEPGASDQISQTSTLQMGQGYENHTGTVYLCLVDNEMTIYSYVETSMTSGSFSLSATKFSFVGNPQQAVADNLQFDCSVTCTSGSFANPVTVYIGPKGTNQVNQAFSSEETYFLNRGETASCTVSGRISDATVGSQYTAYLGYPSNNKVYVLRSLNFTIAAMSGVESVTDGNDGEITVTADGENLAVAAPAPIAAVSVYTVDGRAVGDITVSGSSATAASLPRGLLLVSVLLENGTSKTIKLAH